jgi:hypothetical protein
MMSGRACLWLCGCVGVSSCVCGCDAKQALPTSYIDCGVNKLELEPTDAWRQKG